MPTVVKANRLTHSRLTKRQVLITIVATSSVWIALDALLFFNNGGYNSMENKLPFERRRASIEKESNIRDPSQAAEQNDIEIKSRTEGREDPKEAGKQINNPGQMRDSKGILDRLISHSTGKNVQNLPEDRTRVLKPPVVVQGNETSDGKVREEWKQIQPPANDHLQPVKDLDVKTLPFSPFNPGEDGKAVITNPWDQQRVQEGWARASFNEFVSDKISFERSIPDTRNKDCKFKNYDYSLLPKTSIIVCFTEESWSTLLRSLHSILNRTPPELIEEILLVDDFSQSNFQGRSLSKYISKYPKVRLIRLPSRHGLVRARIAGIEHTTGEVVTFLDSHIECNKGWLEPLLETIRVNRKTIVSPIIDTISDQTFQYLTAKDNLRGGFTWSLEFRWVDISENLSDRTKNIITPAIAGGLFSIDRKFFHELGLYDPGLEIWGSENMELSFKAWMCGGSLEMVPCSRVGHVFRYTQPYKFPKGNINTFFHNNIRIAEVWMEDHKNIFYAMIPSLRKQDPGDLSDRRQLKESMHCNTFQWYLDNIYPEQHVPSLTPVAGLGLHNLKSDSCLDRGVGLGPIKLLQCHRMGGNQHFQLAESGIIETLELCIGRVGATLNVVVMNCRLPGVLRFKHDRVTGLLMIDGSSRCLGFVGTNPLTVQLVDCDSRDESQRWQFLEYHESIGNRKAM